MRSLQTYCSKVYALLKDLFTQVSGFKYFETYKKKLSEGYRKQLKIFSENLQEIIGFLDAF